MERVEDPEFFYPGYDWGTWARPDSEHLKRLMRYVVENPEEARRRGRRAREEAERLWSWEAAAHVAMEHVRELRAGGSGGNRSVRVASAGRRGVP